MNQTCKQIRELLLDELLDGQPAGQDRQTAGHLDRCPACRGYREGLLKGDRELMKMGRQFAQALSSKAEKTAAAFLSREDFTPRRSWMPFAVYAAAAVLIAAAVLGLLWVSREGKVVPRQYAAPGGEPVQPIPAPERAGPEAERLRCFRRSTWRSSTPTTSSRPRPPCGAGWQRGSRPACRPNWS